MKVVCNLYWGTHSFYRPSLQNINLNPPNPILPNRPNLNTQLNVTYCNLTLSNTTSSNDTEPNGEGLCPNWAPAPSKA
jgi:hypothetical protein